VVPPAHTQRVLPGGTVGYPAPPRLIRLSVDTECTIQLTGSPIFDYGIKPNIFL
jgi:hypothetical protein